MVTQHGDCGVDEGPISRPEVQPFNQTPLGFPDMVVLRELNNTSVRRGT
jgi:hypothetical protein